MTTSSWVRPVPAHTIANLSKPHWAAMIAIFFDWFVIIGTVVTSVHFSNPLVYLIAVAIIGNRQHGLAILMHDASHGRLLRNKRFGDIISDLFCAWPILITTQSYRENHLKHHQFANTEKDPDFRSDRFPRTRSEIIPMLLRDVMGLNTWEQIKLAKKYNNEAKPGPILPKVVFYGTVLALTIYFQVWTLLLLYWFVPMFTWFKLVLRIRAVADHTGVHMRTYPFDTRTIVPTILDRIFFAPHNCSYHLGHHLYANVPCLQLKKLHKELMKFEHFRENSQIVYGFHNLLTCFPKTLPHWENPTFYVGSHKSAEVSNAAN
jgi:fatty acid desaturase